MTDTTLSTVDFLDPELWRSNPHDTWARLRAEDPVHRDERNGLWAITRHADVLEVERRDDVFSSEGHYRAIPAPEEADMIAQDDPRHLQQRRLVNRRFTPKAARGHGDEFRTLITELLDDVADAGEMEVVNDLAAQLPSRLTCRLLGFPEDRWADLKRWSEQLMRTDMRERSPEAGFGMMVAGQEFGTLMQEVVGGGCPAGSLLDTWTTATIDGEPLSPETIVHETGLFIAGGAETTRTAIAHGLRAFCDHPDQWELLAAEPDRIPLAVEEVIRWVTPLNNFFRRATRDHTLRGTEIREDDRVIIVYPSANRDEDVFTDPFRFDVTRDPNPHLSFGHGTHFCLGANFARHELQVLFEELTSRFTDLVPLDEPDVEPNIFARAVRSFRLGFSRR